MASGLERSLREGRIAMAGVYGLAIVEAWVLMAALGVRLGAVLGMRLG